MLPRVQKLLQFVVAFHPVGERLPTVSTTEKGLSPQSTSIRLDYGPTRKWVLLAKISNGQRPLGLTGVIGSFSDKPCVFIRSSLMFFENAKNFTFYIDGLLVDDYTPKFKYKISDREICLWGYIGFVYLDYSRAVSDVLIEQEPASDAVDITGNIE